MTKTPISHQVYEMMAICKNPHISYGFLKGSGGTGKTFSIAQFIKASKIKHHQYLFIGPTGKSVSVAEEKGLAGSTIHRFFMIQKNSTTAEIDKFISMKYGTRKKYYTEMRKKLLEIKYVFIDEISMTNDQLLTHILQTLVHAGKENLNVFMVGDYHQLPAVLKGKTTAEESLAIVEELITERAMKTVEFNTRYRCSNEDYNEFLFDIRAGKIHDSKSIANYLRHFFCIHKGNIPEEKAKHLTYLEHTNTKVTEINNLVMDALEGKEYTSEYKIIREDFKTNDLHIKQEIIDDFQMDKTLTYKIGSKILFRVNDIGGLFKNGDEGIIESVSANSIMVNKLTPYGYALIDVKKNIYKTDILEEANGYYLEVEQYPFSLGTARTIHKAQGDGFRYLHLNFDFCTNNILTNQTKWQLFYVCLSRVIDPKEVYVNEQSIKIIEQQWNLFKSINHRRLSLNFESDDMIAENYLRRI